MKTGRLIFAFVTRVIIFTFVYVILTNLDSLLPAMANGLFKEMPIIWLANVFAGIVAASVVLLRKRGPKWVNVTLAVLALIFGIAAAEMLWHADTILPKLPEKLGNGYFGGLAVALAALLAMNLPKQGGKKPG